MAGRTFRTGGDLELRLGDRLGHHVSLSLLCYSLLYTYVFMLYHLLPNNRCMHTPMLKHALCSSPHLISS